MSTVVLAAYSKAYPAITSRIRASVFVQSNPQALVSSQIDSTPGHPARVWSFPGLQRNNYGFLLETIDANGNSLATLAFFDVVPGQTDGTLVRDDEQITVGVTPGFDIGAQTVVFDGTGGKPDYIGWEIVPSELTGRGILVKNLDYTWDSVTGTFHLIKDNDVLSEQTVYNIHFNDKLDTTGGSVPLDFVSPRDFLITYIRDPSANSTQRILSNGEAGRKIIIEPRGTYFEVALPDIQTVPQGREFMFEVEAAGHCTVKVVPFGSNPIRFFRGNLFLCAGDKASVYRFDRNGIAEWRVHNEMGNFKRVGEIVTHDAIANNAYNNFIPVNGQLIDTRQYARLYYDYISFIPNNQLVAFADHNLNAENSVRYSTPSGAQCYVPQRSGLFERINFANVGAPAGLLQIESVGAHTHNIGYVLEGNDGTPTPSGQVLERGPNDGLGSGQGGTGINNYAIRANTPAGLGNYPTNVSVNKYILV